MAVLNQARYATLMLALWVLATHTMGFSQTSEVSAVEGKICDEKSTPLPAATVVLESRDHAHRFSSRTDAQGRFRFLEIPAGEYILSGLAAGFAQQHTGWFTLEGSALRSMDLHLSRVESTPKSSGVQFSDEPQFQIAGITDPTNYGGHGSDTGLRTRESLAREAGALKTASPSAPATSPAGSDANIHRQKGDAAEAQNQPLEAVREYEIAANLDPSEPNLFTWGAELLLHRAYDPAIEVFTKAQHLFPASTRVAVGLSIATYDRGDVDRGEALLLQTCDRNDSDSTPYLFLGRLMSAKKRVSREWTSRFQRFADRVPQSALAHYYYAVALTKQDPEPKDQGVIEQELKQSLVLDPKLGEAHLELGAVYASKKNVQSAVAEFREAIELLPYPDEAHYRLGQLYRQIGDADRARDEIALYHQTSKQKNQEEEQQRHEVQQFVYTLRSQPERPQPAATPQ